MTHSFPGESHPAHPDHEIVSVCSYIIGAEYGIEIWEYPKFKSNKTNKETDKIFLEKDQIETVRINFTREEIALRVDLMKIYITQGFIIEKYKTTYEMFGRVARDPRIIPDTIDFYRGADYNPAPKDIKKAITEFLSRDSAIQVS